jgi:hypothetical protein
LAPRCLAWVPPGCGRSPRSRYSRPRTGRSAPTVAPEPGAAWSPRRIGGAVVVVAGAVVVGAVVVGWVVVGSALVVGNSVVVVSTVLVGAVVLGSTVVVGAVTVGSVVVAPNVDGAPVVVVRPTLAGTPVVAGRAVVAGPLAATRAVSGVLVDSVREVLGSRGRVVVVVDADVGVGWAGNVDSATPPGGRPGVGGAGS